MIWLWSISLYLLIGGGVAVWWGLQTYNDYGARLNVDRDDAAWWAFWIVVAWLPMAPVMVPLLVAANIAARRHQKRLEEQERERLLRQHNVLP